MGLRSTLRKVVDMDERWLVRGAILVSERVANDLFGLISIYSGGGPVGRHVNKVAPVLLNGSRVNTSIPELTINVPGNEAFVRALIDPKLPLLLDLFQQRFAVAGDLTQQVDDLNKFLRIDWRKLTKRASPSGGSLAMISGATKSLTQRVLAKVSGWDAVIPLLNGMPWLIEVVELSQHYAEIALQAMRLFQQEEIWLTRAMPNDLVALVEKIRRTAEEFRTNETVRLTSLEQIAALTADMTELIRLSELEPKGTDRTPIVDAGRIIAEKLSASITQQSFSALTSQKELVMQLAVQQRILQQTSSQAAHLRRAISLLGLWGSATDTMAKILNGLGSHLVTASTATIWVLTTKMVVKNYEAARYLAGQAEEFYLEATSEVRQLVAADRENYSVVVSPPLLE